MPSILIESRNKYVLSYKDSINKANQVGFYAQDADDRLFLPKECNSYILNHSGSVIRFQQNFRFLIMYLKKSQFAIQEKKTKDLDNKIVYPTIEDLIREQNVSNDNVKTVHHRRDLDSLG